MKYSFEEKKHKVGVAATLIFVCILGLVYVLSGRAGLGKAVSNILYQSEENITGDVSEGDIIVQTITDNPDSISENNNQGILVHVCGAVKQPGVYMLNDNSRIKDAIDAAGGFSKKADKEYLNLAESVTDGQKIVVYTKKQTVSLNGKEAAGEIDNDNRGSSKVNINTASKEELMTLTGVGESKAKDIIAYREQNGRFNSIEELMNIPGIKEGVFSGISASVTVDGS